MIYAKLISYYFLISCFLNFSIILEWMFLIYSQFTWILIFLEYSYTNSFVCFKRIRIYIDLYTKMESYVSLQCQRDISCYRPEFLRRALLLSEIL